MCSIYNCSNIAIDNAVLHILYTLYILYAAVVGVIYCQRSCFSESDSHGVLLCELFHLLLQRGLGQFCCDARKVILVNKYLLLLVTTYYNQKILTYFGHIYVND